MANDAFEIIKSVNVNIIVTKPVVKTDCLIGQKLTYLGKYTSNKTHSLLTGSTFAFCTHTKC